jgi:hypothetical protein
MSTAPMGFIGSDHSRLDQLGARAGRLHLAFFKDK